MRQRLVLVFLCGALGCGAAGLVAAADPNPTRAALLSLIDEAWEFRLREEPLFATSAGDHRYDDRLPSVAPADLERQAAFERQLLGRLRGLDRAQLPAPDRISYDMLARSLENELAERDFGAERIPINADSGFHTGFAEMPRRVPLASVKDYENYTARLRAFPGYVQQ
jgi:uncharacterized protein (DUF885 family)